MSDPDLGKAWLETLEHQRRLSPHTLANYSRALGVLFELKEKTALRDLDAAQIRRFVARLHAAGLSGRTLALTLSAWRGLYHWLARHRNFPANPVQGVRAPKSPRHLPKALSVEQAQQLLDGPTREHARGCARPRHVRTAVFLRPAPRGTCGAGPGRRQAGTQAGRSDRNRQGQQDAHRAGRRPRARGAARLARGARAARRAAGAGAVRGRARQAHRARDRAGAACAPGRSARGWAPRCIRTCCAIPSPATCCSPRRTCARCRRCSATPASPPRRSTPTSTSRRWPRSTTRRTRAREKSKTRT